MRTRTTPRPDAVEAQEQYHLHSDPDHRASAVSDVILGGQDGLVNVLGVILGVAAATSDAHIVLVAGLAATFAESVSMGKAGLTAGHPGRSGLELAIIGTASALVGYIVGVLLGMPAPS